MITVGYSTRKENLEYKEHIFKQSGLKKGELDIIEVVNNNQKSLSEVYNSILRDSKHNLVIIIHDDLILPQNFLKSLIKQFNEIK
jgi:hypothetical protein